MLLLAVVAAYEPNWASIDSRPLPSWYDDAKFGLFLHWGVYSVPSFKSEWYWYNLDTAQDAETVAFHNRVYGPDFKYADFGPKFTAELFDPEEWADLFAQSGVKYVVLTSKHHEGFTLYPSSASWNWNSVDTGPHMDLVGALAPAVRKRNITFGCYHSLFEWYHPLYLADKNSNWKTNAYVTDVLMPELHELVDNYQPDVIWSDGDWEAPDTYWNSTGFLAWLYNESPVKDSVVVNDRWGNGIPCKHGGYYTCQDHYQPGHLVNHKWENCMTTQVDSWGYDRRPADPYHTLPELLNQLAATVAYGGNLLLNVGPTWDGRIVQAFKDRLLEMGAWLKVNGDAIYGTQPWTVAQNQTSINAFYTTKGSAVYGIFFDWPLNNQLTFDAPKASPSTTITLLGVSGALSYKAGAAAGITVTLPTLNAAQMPCQYAWTLRFDGLANR